MSGGGRRGPFYRENEPPFGENAFKVASVPAWQHPVLPFLDIFVWCFSFFATPPPRPSTEPRNGKSGKYQHDWTTMQRILTVGECQTPPRRCHLTLNTEFITYPLFENPHTGPPGPQSPEPPRLTKKNFNKKPTIIIRKIHF